jgi:hypothetical protein
MKPLKVKKIEIKEKLKTENLVLLIKFSSKDSS